MNYFREAKGIEDEISRRPKVYVPKSWGTGKLTEEVAFYVVMDGALSEEAKQRAEVDKEIRDLMVKSGLNVVEGDAGIGVLTDENEREFCVSGYLPKPIASKEILRNAVPELGLIEEYNLSKVISGNEVLPFVVSLRNSAGGNGKFLIETEEQRKRFLNFLRTEDGRRIMHGFEYKKFIETPGDWFTSYRVVVTTAGEVLAAGLLYSQVLKSENEVCKIDLPVDKLGNIGTNFTDYLVVPGNPYFLNSRRITSNISKGGGCIPLCRTEKSRKITLLEEEILRQHGLTEFSKPPGNIDGLASKIAKSLGRRMGLVVGVDFIQDQNGKCFYLETNAEPGMQTYIDVKMNGQGSLQEAYREVMTAAVKSVLKC